MRIGRWFFGTLAVVAVSASMGCSDRGSTSPTKKPPPTPSFVKLESDAGDFVGVGESYTYDQTQSIIGVSAHGGHLSIGIRGDETWFGDFWLPSGFQELQGGNFSTVPRFPDNAGVSSLNWSLGSRRCGTITGSFSIDSLTYAGPDSISAIDIRFEQHCGTAAAALRGTIHWRADDHSRPPGPVEIPANLWKPLASALPSGNYVYLQSSAGDLVGAGLTYTYAFDNVTTLLSADGGYLALGVDKLTWYGWFHTMYTLQRLEVGYYPDLRRYPDNNPTKGGLAWFAPGRECATVGGWFAIDRVTYNGSRLTSIDLRFEQRCNGTGAPLHGAIHWSA
jgi:hypothetical protein